MTRSDHVLSLSEMDPADVSRVGGKAANLAALAKIDGLQVPPGFCVTADAYRQAIADAGLDEQLDALARVRPDDHESLREAGAAMRAAIEALVLPGDLIAAIEAALDERAAYAVRSSATAEDRPTASFAGQHDSFLGLRGTAPVVAHVVRCWASLFTERAVTYRRRNGYDDRRVAMAVLVQRMVAPRAAGVLFTADPVSSDRTVTCIEAVPGLGDALVTGQVSADAFRVRDGEVIGRALVAGLPVLTDPEVLELARVGRRIEARFGAPQDVEWCLARDGVHVVQSRPITTLFPVPVADDAERHVYLSVGHQQMMTDALTPLGISVRQLTAGGVMHEAGGRLFVDATPMLASPAGRAAVLTAMEADSLMLSAVRTVLDRGFLPEAAGPPVVPRGLRPVEAPAADPGIVAELMQSSRDSIAALEREIATKAGTDLFEFLRADFAELKRILFEPRSHQVFMSAMDAASWLNDNLFEWLGEKNVSDTLTLSVPDNVTSQMGLALLDVADVVRRCPEGVACLREGGEDVLTRLADGPGGREARDAIQAWLDDYGMRCPGEIDIARERWSERPELLVPLILTEVDNVAPGESQRRFDGGLAQARAKEQDVLERVRALPDGTAKAAEVKTMIDRLRTFIGYREFPKYGMIARYFVYKQALLSEAERLVDAGVVRERDDVFFLTFDEFAAVVRTGVADPELLAQRRAAFRWHQTLTPPRVLTSDGECLDGTYERSEQPAGSLIGLPVSAGTVEGRARIVHDLADADLGADDILVTAHTDPGWTPLFPLIVGLVTEVGGLMTHGAVVAREYGLPAVVGVERATELIADGQRIRVNGTDGYVEILDAT